MVDPRTQRASAIRLQRIERGRQARSLRRIGPPFTPAQRRSLEDALSVATNAAMGLDASEGRLAFIARHLAAQDDGRVPAPAPRREGKLTPQQNEELALVVASIGRAVNAANCKVGSPLRNVAEHLLLQHKKWKKGEPLTAQDRARAARNLAMRSAAPSAVEQQLVEPKKPSRESITRHDAAVAAALAEEAARDPIVLEARKAAIDAFEKYDVDKSGSIAPQVRSVVGWSEDG